MQERGRENALCVRVERWNIKEHMHNGGRDQGIAYICHTTVFSEAIYEKKSHQHSTTRESKQILV